MSVSDQHHPTGLIDLNAANALVSGNNSRRSTTTIASEGSVDDYAWYH